ncbi:MAG: pilin [Candidatus Saccharibacteria bacterium]|nr:pilin [Candidatus Saccharibacteria bacterium]
MKRLGMLLAAGAMMVGVVLSPLMASPAQAQISDGLAAAKTDEMTKKDPKDIVTQIINIMLYIIAILSVIMLIWGGIQYTTSGGDSNKVTSAKNTILYSIIGLVVAIFAWAIVNWVVEQFK